MKKNKKTKLKKEIEQKEKTEDKNSVEEKEASNEVDIDIEKALSDKYPNKCKKCSYSPCRCEK